MHKRDAEVEKKRTRAEKAATRRAIRRERRSSNRANAVDEVKDFAQKIGDECGREITDEAEISRVVLLK